MSTDRPGFRPTRTRASLSALPASSSASSASLLPNKENGASTLARSFTSGSADGSKRKKRAQSLGGDALDGARKKSRQLDDLRREATITLELSPGKLERRRAAPRRSILKHTPAVFENHTLNFGPRPALHASLDPASHTTDLSSLHTFNSSTNRRRSSIKPTENAGYDDSDEDDDDDPNGSMDMDITRMEVTTAYDADGRRKSVSHSRRVSFAPNAHVRHFTPDKPTAQAQALAAAQAAAAAAALAAAEQSAAGDASFTSSTHSASSSSEASDNEEDDDLQSEPSMEIAGDEVTLAFRGHFAGTQLPLSALEPDDESSASENENEDGTQAMEEVTGDVTSAMWGQQTGLFNSQAVHARAQAEEQQVATASVALSSRFELHGPLTAAASAQERARPRFSEVARAEDDDDEQVMRELGFSKGGKPRKSRIAFADIPEEEVDDDNERGREADVDDGDDTGAMEMTTAIGRLLPSPDARVREQEEEDDDEDDAAEEAEVSMQLTGSASISGEQTIDMDMSYAAEATSTSTIAMVEATAYGSILSAPLPAPDQLRRSASPARVTLRASSPMKSPGRALSAPPATGLGIATPTKSPFRRSAAFTSPAAGRRSSPLPSPRRIAVPSTAPVLAPAFEAPTKSPARSRSRSTSPVKSGFQPPSSLAVPPKSPRRASLSPALASGTPSKSSTPARLHTASSKAVTPGPTTTSGTISFQPRTLAPPQSAGRSPGGSLSLRGLLAQQKAQDSPVAKDGRVGELREGEELNLTGSEFDASFSASEGGDARPVLASLDDFFSATSTTFVNDIVGMAGVDLSSSRARRKSMAVNDDERSPSGPPSFADIAVAGGCKSLFYQLYQSDQLRLHEGIQEAQQMYAEIVDAINTGGEVPKIFQQWADATEEGRAIMKSQFGQIKLYYLLQGQVAWKECRAENYSQIIRVMEQSLEALREDRAVLSQIEFDGVIPSLEERHAALKADLLAERALDAELASYSPEQVAELEDLLAGIEEQEEQLNGNGGQGIRTQFESAEQRLQKNREGYEADSRKTEELQREIAELEELRRDKRTKADLIRLKAEYDALQHLHGWTLQRFSTSSIQLRHYDEFDVTLQLDPASLQVTAAQLALLAPKKSIKSTAALNRSLNEFLLGKISEEVKAVIAENGERDPRSILRLISARSLVLRHIRHEAALASLRFPIATRTLDNGNALLLEIDVFCARSRKAFVVRVPITAAELEVAGAERWAEGISAQVKAKFGGDINSIALQQTINDRLEGGYGRNALVEAVMAAEEECDHTA
ncbi:hypothetical protein JCM1841_002031 [Sporobolomyces salmonicolor]